nr:type transport system ATP-binding protein [Candidatus Cloacimonadota bacterium]
MINIKNLNKTYGFVHALRDVNLHIQDGYVYGVVGSNGAGKTTLFECIAGLINYSGSIEFTGNNIKNQMGFLHTEPYFPSLITGREYLQLICNARKLKSVDFDETNIFELPLNSYVSTYSTGMKKKIALTGILLQKNQVYILDEPFNGIDVQSNMLVTEILLRLKAKKKTMIISSHILSTLSEVCDYYVVLKDGKIDKNVNKEAFQDIEKEIRRAEIGNKIEKLKLG